LTVAILIFTKPNLPATSIAVTTYWCRVLASALIVNGNDESPPEIFCRTLRIVSALLSSDSAKIPAVLGIQSGLNSLPMVAGLMQ